MLALVIPQGIEDLPQRLSDLAPISGRPLAVALMFRSKEQFEAIMERLKKGHAPLPLLAEPDPASKKHNAPS